MTKFERHAERIIQKVLKSVACFDDSEVVISKILILARTCDKNRAPHGEDYSKSIEITVVFP